MDIIYRGVRINGAGILLFFFLSTLLVIQAAIILEIERDRLASSGPFSGVSEAFSRTPI